MDPTEVSVQGLTGGDDEPATPSPPRRRDQEDDTITGRRFEALQQEYSRALAENERQLDRMIRVAGIGFSAAGALLFLVAQDTIELGEWAYWLGPFLLTLLCDIVIFLIYMMVFYAYYTRDLEDDIAELTGISYFHITNTVARGLTSYRTGYLPMLITTSLMVVFIIGIYLTFFVLSFLQLRSLDVPLWRQTAFVVVQLSLSLSLLWSGLGVWTNLRERYETWREIPSSQSRVESLRLTLMRFVRDRVRPSADPDGVSTNRFVWLVAIAALTAALALILPTQTWLVVVALGLPLVAAANYQSLTFEEITSVERALSQGPGHVVYAIDQLLFHPWAVRISIRPVPNARTGSCDESWAVTLMGMYQTWARKGREG